MIGGSTSGSRSLRGLVILSSMPGMEKIPQSVTELEEMLSAPPAGVVEAMRRVEGDLLLLGAGGKMGPTMARMARRAADEAGTPRRLLAVSRFSDEAVRERLASWGVETISCDLLDEEAVGALPDAPNVISMSGFKFGTQSAPHLTWATNCLIPAHVCRRFSRSRIVAFSSGNVYGVVPVSGTGSRETDPLRPQGEYSNAALGRERIYEYFSRAGGTPLALVRLNYATELRYGVLVDLALQVAAGEQIDLTMAYVNVLWLGDANAMTLRALEHCDSPARIINMAGREILRVREVCERLGQLLGVPAKFTGEESGVAYLNDGAAGYELLGEPSVEAEAMIRMTANWVGRGGALHGKPTKFQVHDGKF